MAHPIPATGSDPTSSPKMVFASTNLDTHLAVSVSVSETISDIKRKILLQHPICFPKVGEIEIHALKLKRRGIFYHLPDSEYIKHVFDGVKSSWYLYVDASTLLERSEKLHSIPNSDNLLARFCAINNSSADEVHMLPDGASRSLLQIEHNPCVNQEVPITEQFCLGESSRESSKDLTGGDKRTGDNHCKPTSPATSMMPDLETRGKCDLQKEDCEVVDNQIESMVDNPGNGISDKQGDLLLEGVTQIKPTAKGNRRNKPKKKIDDIVRDLVVKENDALAGGPPKDAPKHDVVVAEDTRMENGSVVQEPCRISSSDASKQLDTGVQMTNDLSKVIRASVQEADGNIDKSENGVVIVKCSNLLGVISEHSSPAKKKRKRLRSGVQKTNDLCGGVEVSVGNVADRDDKSENGIVDIQCNNVLGDVSISVQSSPAKKKRKTEKSSSNKDACEDMTTLEYSLGEKNKSKNAASEGLSVEYTEEIYSMQTSSSTGKKTRRRKSSDAHKAVAAVLSPVKELREESAQGFVENNHKGSVESEAVVTGESVPGEIITKVNSVSLKEKDGNTVEEVAKRNVPCSLDADVGDAIACDVGAETDVSGVGKIINSRSCHVDLKDRPPSIVEEPNDLQLNTNTMVEEARELYQNDNTEDKTPEPAKSSKKSKKSKRTKDAGRGTQVMSSTITAVHSVSLKEKHDTVEEVAKRNVPCSLDVDKGDANACDVGAETDVSGVKKDTSKSFHVDLEDRPPSTIQEPNDLQLNTNTIGEYHKRTRVDQADAVEEARELYQNDNTEDKAPELAKSSKRPKKSKRTKDSGQGTQVISSTENPEGSVTDIGLAELHRSVKADESNKKCENDVNILSHTEGNDVSRIKIDSISIMATDGETETRAQEEVPLLQQSKQSQESGVSVDGKRKRKTKKRQINVARSAQEDQEKDQDVGLQIPVPSSDTEWIDVSKINTDGIPLMATGGETEKRTQEEVPALQISKSQAGGENVDGKKKKRSKKRPTDVARNLPEVQEKDQDLGLKSHVMPSDTKVVNVSSETIKEAKLAKTSSLDPKETGIASHTLDTGLVSGTVDCSQVPSRVDHGNDEVKALEAAGNAKYLNSGCVDESDNQKEDSCESNGVNFKDYFIHGQHEQEVKSAGKVVDNKVIKENKSDRELKTKKNSGKHPDHPISESPNLQGSLKVKQSQGSKRKSQDGNFGTTELPISSLKESNGPLLQSNKTASKVSGSRIIPGPSDKSLKLNSVSEEPRKPSVLIASGFSTPMGKNNEVNEKQPRSGLGSPKDTQRTKKSNKHQSRNDLFPMSVRKSSGSNMGEVLNKTESKKSLLATSGAIFKDDSSKSSSLGDQAGVDSDATTRTPSNDMSSSDCSDGESYTSQTGSYNSKREERGKKTPSQSLSSVPKSMTLDTILRSSSRYKKAKLIASQSQPEDTENQTVDFVPDSQADA